MTTTENTNFNTPLYDTPTLTRDDAWADAYRDALEAVVDACNTVTDGEYSIAAKRKAGDLCYSDWSSHTYLLRRIDEQRSKVRNVLARHSTGAEIDNEILQRMIDFGHTLAEEAAAAADRLVIAKELHHAVTSEHWVDPDTRRTQKDRSGLTATMLAARSFLGTDAPPKGKPLADFEAHIAREEQRERAAYTPTHDGVDAPID